MYSGGGKIMNAKGIKALRWHKKSLIDAMAREGIDMRATDAELTKMIDYFDTMRLEMNEVNIAHDKGFTIGYEIGYDKGVADTHIGSVDIYAGSIDYNRMYRHLKTSHEE